MNITPDLHRAQRRRIERRLRKTPDKMEDLQEADKDFGGTVEGEAIHGSFWGFGGTNSNM